MPLAYTARYIVLLAIALLMEVATSTKVFADTPTVMVLYFDNNTNNPDFDYLSKGLADMTITDLAATRELTVIERDKLEAILRELKLQQTKFFDPKTAQRLGKGLGAQYAITGAFTSVDPIIRLDIRMVRIENAVVVNTATVTGNKSDFFALQQQLMSKMLGGLKDLLPKTAFVPAARPNRIAKLESIKDYSLGLDARDRGDYDTAAKHLKRVVDANPGFPLGQERYEQAMAALSLSKNRRETILSTNEQVLLAHAQSELAVPVVTKRALAYGILLGQIHQLKVSEYCRLRARAEDCIFHLHALVENMLWVANSLANTTLFPPIRQGRDVTNYLERSDRDAARQIGITNPAGITVQNTSPDFLRGIGRLLILGKLEFYESSRFNDPAINPCLYLLDPTFASTAIDAFERALAFHEYSRSSYKVSDYLRTLQEYALALVVMGRHQEAIAKLQHGLDRYPTSEEFQYVEALVKRILSGEEKAKCAK